MAGERSFRAWFVQRQQHLASPIIVGITQRQVEHRPLRGAAPERLTILVNYDLPRCPLDHLRHTIPGQVDLIRPEDT